MSPGSENTKTLLMSSRYTSFFFSRLFITIHLPFIGISRENRKFPENFLFCFDFTMNSKYVIFFHFESNQISSKKREKNPQIFGNLRKLKLLYLPLTRENRKFSGMTRDVIGFKME